MKKLFNFKSKRKGLGDFHALSLEESEANRLSGGFKEYKPTIYSSDKHQSVRIKVSQLLSGMEEIV
ncbi:hypothetical protein K3G39_19045 [Pontibacter sp. HSC-14F20]|uniref:hypothetical protein n=1 Tax=Pontibacter sp. HSC-14F20 TaxID=2864136 RepID=UPI001C73B7AE|nr:hypothetical protein [Pontibacter sp. HSC-14F20]MBX0335337.1 hypothetical protein [Pontibacter sp. HSC-14F20]